MSLASATDLVPRVLVAYHANCLDGFTAAWVVHSAYKAQYQLECELLPMFYGEEGDLALLAKLRETEYDELVVVDFSLTLEMLSILQLDYPELSTIILDHHKTAFERYFPGLKIEPDTIAMEIIQGCTILLNNGRSGAGLAMSYFADNFPYYNPKKGAKKLVGYVQDYDLWRFNYGLNTKYMNAILSRMPQTFPSWNAIVLQYTVDGFGDILEQGQRYYEHTLAKIAQVAAAAIPVYIQGAYGLVVACPYKMCSSVGHTLATTSGTFGLMYEVYLEKNEVKWSLRSNGDYDVSVIAKKFGGGGHKNAAGFTTPFYPAAFTLESTDAAH